MSTTSGSTLRAASSRITYSDGSWSVRAGTYKRIIVCCDGSWQGSDKGVETVPSNIARLVKAIAPKKTEDDGHHETQQIVYYQSGVGTSSSAQLGNVAAGATGAGLDDNVLEAYYFICNNAEPDDEIFLFGFSRGAYTVRTLSGLLEEFDIIDRYSLHQFPALYKAYKARTKETSEAFRKMYDNLSVSLSDNDTESLVKTLQAKKIVKYPAYIKVIGCFDTVGSMGIPENGVVKFFDLNSDQKFRDPRLSLKVENAFHALALDDHRRPFTPTMWHQPLEGRDIFPYIGPNLQQVWFPGMHINVGGGGSDNKPVTIPRDDPTDGILTPSEFVQRNQSWGSWIGSKISGGLSAINPLAPLPETGSDGISTLSNSDNEEMADITLMWMIDRCRPFLEFNERYLDYLIDEHAKKVSITRKQSVARLSLARLIGQKEMQFGYACGPFVDSYSGVMSLGGSQRRAPGQYTTDGFTGGNIIDETQARHHTNEYIHPCVRWRYFNNGDEYKTCRGLDGFKLVDYTKDPGRSPLKNDPLSGDVIWERQVPKPVDKSDSILRLGEAKVKKEITWTEKLGDKPLERKKPSLEYRLMGDDIWQELQQGQSFDTPIKGKSFYQ